MYSCEVKTFSSAVVKHSESAAIARYTTLECLRNCCVPVSDDGHILKSRRHEISRHSFNRRTSLSDRRTWWQGKNQLMSLDPCRAIGNTRECRDVNKRLAVDSIYENCSALAV